MDNKEIAENALDPVKIEIKQEYDVCLEEESESTSDTSNDIRIKTEYDELYRDHIIKDEIVIGPEALSRPSSSITLESGFTEGSSCNLPKIGTLMIASFFARNKGFGAAECRNVKNPLSSRESYGDNAIEYVQLRRELNICTVKCHVCPEHKVCAKSYAVTINVDEKNNVVINAQCHDCASSESGCKHAVAFLMWLHRRSEEPSRTQVECYWNISNPSKAGSTLKFITTKELAKTQSSIDSNTSVFDEFVKQATAKGINNCGLLKYLQKENSDVEGLSIYQLVLNYREECSEEFIEKISPLFTTKLLNKVEENTRDQMTSNLWHELRFGRVTASMAHDVKKCKTNKDALVSSIMGEITDTPALNRRRVLENKVLQIVQTMLQKRIRKCGLFISKDFPMIAGCPSGIGDEFIIEIKCPFNENSIKKYMHNEKPSNKYYDQIQIQMYVSGYKQCYFCVADVDFQNNNKVDMILVQFDEEYVNSFLKSLLLFWEQNVYPLLYNTTKT